MPTGPARVAAEAAPEGVVRVAIAVRPIATSVPPDREEPARPQRGRYRYPGDAVRLGAGGLLALGALIVAFQMPDRLMGSRAAAVSVIDPSSSGAKLLTGLLQYLAVLAPLIVTVTVLRRRRYRLAATLVVAGAAAFLAVLGLEHLVGGGTSPVVLVHGHAESWLARASFPGLPVFAAASAVLVGLEPWLTRPWQRATWAVLIGAAAVRLVLGTVVPMGLVLAILVGTTVGLALIVGLGVPDRRLDAEGVATVLGQLGIQPVVVAPADVMAKGSRPFLATTVTGRRLFVKVLGVEQRTADLLYRAYRLARLRGVGDTRPAASLTQAVEHQALVGMLADRAGVRVPRVERISQAADGSVLLVLEAVDGVVLDRVEPERLDDNVLTSIWEEVDRLHRAGIAHRSLRSGNMMLDGEDRPWIIDFGFSQIDATDLQSDIDVAELLASLSAICGPDRTVRAAVGVLGAPAVGSAIKFLQPLALSFATRRALKSETGLLGEVRGVVAAASGASPEDMARVVRVRPRTLLMMAVAAGAFYFLLPQLAHVGDSWRAFGSGSWSWIAFVLAMSAVTYLGAAVAMLGTVRQRLAFVPTLFTQLAGSFVNRVTPANVGGMALNGRFLQKSGADAGTAIAGVALNSLAGAASYGALMVTFFTWSGSDLAKSFKLPSASKVLVVIVVVGAVAGGVLVTGWGRRRLLKPVRRGIHSSLVNLREVAKSPAKLAMLFGGSLVVTLAYIAAFAGAARAFGGTLPVATLGAVYLGGKAIAAAAPTPGNLGALEAALAAGLTGVGMTAGAAVSAVLTYRLATYWIPILPGWLAWHLVQRWGYA